jgi:riboflavin kinase/FMN adenylyltransferase
MMNLGPRPTFGDSERSIEAHLFDVDADFYGMRVRIDFFAYLRETKKFADASELIRQLEKDRENALSALTPSRGSGNLIGSPKTAKPYPSVA